MTDKTRREEGSGGRGRHEQGMSGGRRTRDDDAVEARGGRWRLEEEKEWNGRVIRGDREEEDAGGR